LARLALLSERLSSASHERFGCVSCGLAKRCGTPFIKPYVPAGWESGRRILLLGEGPGGDEDKAGRPFVGRAGKLLQRLWKLAGYRDVDIALHNAVRCRPPGNATPTVSQMRACRPFVLRTIEVLRPHVIIGLGTTAAKSLTNLGNASVTSCRGRLLQVPGLSPVGAAGPEPLPTVYVTYHPAAILHGASHLADKIVEDLRRPMLPAVTHPTVELPSGRILAFDTEWAPDGTILTVALSDATKAIAFENLDLGSPSNGVPLWARGS
jgi:uracil-DNA glycosylase family 4